MPGAYAHITLVNLLKETRRLDAISGFPNPAKGALLKYFKYCEMGAVSPDYPYLALGDKNAAAWADAMHYEQTGKIIHAGVRRVRDLKGQAKQKCLAWLLGYAAHVATDVTIHPVVELKVGPYKGNEMDHRICEMHQDVHIYHRLDLGGIDLSEHLDTGICTCGNADEIDGDILQLWAGMLGDVHPTAYASNTLDPHKWHRGFRRVVDNFATEGNRLLPLARHVASGLGLMYPPEDGIDKAFIVGLETPAGKRHYDDIFDRAIKNVATIWLLIANGALRDEQTYLTKIGNWNLDTGKDSTGHLVFWR